MRNSKCPKNVFLLLKCYRGWNISLLYRNITENGWKQKKYEETVRYKPGSWNWWMTKQRKGKSNCIIFISVI